MSSGFENDEKQHNVPQWAFPGASTDEVFVQAELLEGDAAVHYVVHDDDGDWQFLAGGDPGFPELVCFHCFVALHPDVATLTDLPIGWSALRTDNGWSRTKAAPLED